MMREPITIMYVIPGFGEMKPKPVVGEVLTPRNVKLACEMAGISLTEVRSRDRTRDVSYRRFHVMAILRSWGRTYPQIGQLLGGRDHTTVLAGVRRYREIEAAQHAAASRPVTPAEVVAA